LTIGFKSVLVYKSSLSHSGETLPERQCRRALS
jgi:hypothetical protein